MDWSIGRLRIEVTEELEEIMEHKIMDFVEKNPKLIEDWLKQAMREAGYTEVILEGGERESLLVDSTSEQS